MKEIDYTKIGKIIDFITIKLNNYMIDVPEILLNGNEYTNLLAADRKTIDNQFKIDLGTYFAGMVMWYSSNKKASDGIIEYCNENTPLMPKEMVADLMRKNPNAKVNLMDTTKHLMALGVATYQRRIASTKNISVFEIPKACAGNLLNEYFNQKVSDYNLTLVVEGFNKVSRIIKGEE